MSVHLPIATDAPRCAEFARSIELDPGGTALAPDVIVVAEVAEPWPKPVAKHPDLVELVAACVARSEQVRLLAAVPRDSGPRRVVAFRPAVGGALRAESEIHDDPRDALASALDVDAVDTVSIVDGRRTMLICTQGSHDVCCGTEGAEFADEMSRQQPDVELFRVSHTGGHRFAPTAMTLPDGRMWANLTPAIASRILERDLDPVLAASHCRGWWGAPTGPSQIAERAVFAQLGWSVDEVERSVDVTEAETGYDVTVTTDLMRWQVRIELGREVPTIKCESPGGLPVKPSREWVVAQGPVRLP
ncbi:MAG: sucrase ferredoxin [Acidimicrobiales bacterium]